MRVPSSAVAYQLHSDLYIHILLDNATGTLLPDVSDQEVAEALGHAQRDYEAAIKYSNSEEERHVMELDLQLISTNWRGLVTHLERYYSESGCNASSWAHGVSVNFGFANRLLPREVEFRKCDPLSTSNWRAEARARLWAGDAEGAIETSFEGSEYAPGPWLTDTLVRALVANGEFERAEAENSSRAANNFDALISQTLIAAAKGDKEAAETVFNQFNLEEGTGDFYNLMYYAWIGDKDKANEIASTFDANPYGSMGLNNVLISFSCGARWELSATPTYAKRLEEAGLPWPPVDVIKFPLKHW